MKYLTLLTVVFSLVSCGSEEFKFSPAAIVTFSCPANYILIPHNTSYGTTSDFCVMKYEARAWTDSDLDLEVDAAEVDADGCLEGSCTTPEWGSSQKPVSTDTGLPWRMILPETAKNRCSSLGVKYDLISNPEWMTIAVNIEAQDVNWSGSTVGNGCLFRGNAGVADACTYNGSNPEGEDSSLRNTKARLTLSNGEVIWDLSGNVWEYIDWTLGGSYNVGPTTCAGTTWVEFPVAACGALAASDFMPENPSGVVAANYNSNYGLGKFKGGAIGGVYRGGSWGAALLAGVFQVAMDADPSDLSYADPSIGFRCVYRQ